MEQPREVNELIETMAKAGWEVPTVVSGHFNNDGTGAFIVAVMWGDDGNRRAAYQSDRGWVGVYGPRGMTYTHAASGLPQADISLYLLQYAAQIPSETR